MLEAFLRAVSAGEVDKAGLRRALAVRAVHPDDVEAVAERVRLADEPNVLPRPLSEYRRASAEGALFAVSTDCGIQAVSGVFDSGNPAYGECGGTLVLPEFRGFGLQKILFQVRFAATAIEDPPVQLVSGIKPTNQICLRNANRVGFEPWTKPVPSLLEACGACRAKGALVSRQCCCDFYLLPRCAQAAGVRDLLALPALVTRIHRDDGRTVLLRLDVKAVTETAFREDLQDFAERHSPRK